ncbi:MAG: hypothetical protein NUW24_14280 [Anaerolineae bacterium]|jgi:hypothetical protein|nr:hypothetical protein [Anaerolineae bacterium]MDH7475347.1 hypothetical protein [Anaerolineae bacterium]
MGGILAQVGDDTTVALMSDHRFGPLHGDGKWACIVDLAPTLLHLMGEAVPEDMDGQVLHDIFEPAFEETHAVRYQVATAVELPEAYALSSEEEVEIEDRLRGLGYLG